MTRPYGTAPLSYLPDANADAGADADAGATRARTRPARRRGNGACGVSHVWTASAGGL